MTATVVLSISCILVYCLAIVLVWQYTKGSSGKSNYIFFAEKSIILIISLAALLHGISLYLTLSPINLQTMPLGNGLSIAGWVSVLIYIVTSLIRRVISSGLIVLPIGLVAFLISLFLSEQSINPDHPLSGAGWHIALAIPTYGVLCVAFAQAILIIMQDRILHSPSRGAMMTKLPAMQTMESNLFWLTLVGFCLMTINLGFGMVSSMKSSGYFLQFNHHILLSIAAWICFGCLLIGRRIAGWRGQVAAKWTIAAFTILILAYFGTRIVKDVILSNS